MCYCSCIRQAESMMNASMALPFTWPGNGLTAHSLRCHLIFFSASIKMKRSIDQLSETWSVANEVDVDKFLRFYKRYRIVTPFSDHENLIEVS
ncbi:unnamed protein product [Anisakis simplex]|uniref:DDE-1 domain-containing protein n=1 Tax=Anisakis simplex TaxID=6269 RepID=A0A0M3JIR2_ANISI|nr:unnamed protein product [Anisakis simplex]